MQARDENYKGLAKEGQSCSGNHGKAGGKLLAWYLTMGQYDAVAIVEGPDDATMATVGLAIGSKGDVRTTTLKAHTEAQMAKIVEKIPQ